MRREMRPQHMNEQTNVRTMSIERVPTRVPGLDVILGGGLLRGGVYLLMGTPGAGKTLLSNQIGFAHAKDGGRATYITLLAESHSRMLAHIEGMAFYEPGLISKSVFYLSGYSAFEQQKLDGLLDIIRTEVRSHGSSIVVIDGVVSAGESELSLKRFVHELKAYTELTGAVCLILTSAMDPGRHYPARTMVDGLLELSLADFGMRTAREIEIVKLRGSPQLMGRHLFEISNAGITVFPRLEAIYGHSSLVEEQRRRLALGLAGLDSMLGGGFMSGSVTILLGPPGSGKTLLGLQFLNEGCERGEVGLYYGFYETPARLVSKAESVGMRLGVHVLDRKLLVRWVAPLEQFADDLIAQLITIVRETGATRVVLDGIGGVAQSMLHRERLDNIITALANELRALNVTAVMTEESAFTPSSVIDLPMGRLSAAVDNLIVVRYVERSGVLERFLSILKMREGEYDASVTPFTISARGLEVKSGRERGRSRNSSAPRKRPAKAGAKQGRRK